MKTHFSSPQGIVYPLALMWIFRWELIIVRSYLRDNTDHTDLVETRLSELTPYKNDHAEFEKESLTAGCFLLIKDWHMGRMGMVGLLLVVLLFALF